MFQPQKWSAVRPYAIGPQQPMIVGSLVLRAYFWSAASVLAVCLSQNAALLASLDEESGRDMANRLLCIQFHCKYFDILPSTNDRRWKDKSPIALRSTFWVIAAFTSLSAWVSLGRKRPTTDAGTWWEGSTSRPFNRLTLQPLTRGHFYGDSGTWLLLWV